MPFLPHGFREELLSLVASVASLAANIVWEESAGDSGMHLTIRNPRRCLDGSTLPPVLLTSLFTL